MTLFVLATEMGYAISDLFGNVISTPAEWSFICDAAYWDYMLVPQERLADWKTFFLDLRRN